MKLAAKTRNVGLGIARARSLSEKTASFNDAMMFLVVTEKIAPHRMTMQQILVTCQQRSRQTDGIDHYGGHGYILKRNALLA